MIIQQLQKKILNENNLFQDILGQQEVKKSISSALVMGRNIVIVGPPGVGKTTLAKNIAKLLPEIEVIKDCSYNCTPEAPVCHACKLNDKKNGRKISTRKIDGIERFIRVQGSPDLTVEDLIGDIDPVKAFKHGALSIEAFTPGKIFKSNNGILFFDELNRCPEKIQNSLLQILEEKKATVSSYDIDIEIDFIFIATMNPEDSSTEKLSDVLTDRFDFIYMYYPETIEIEKQIVEEKGKKVAEVPPKLLNSMVYFVRLLRESDKLEKKPSVRASIGLYERSQSNALLNNRKSVTMQDIEDVYVSVLSHRLRLKPSVRYLQSPESFIREKFGKEVKGSMAKGIESGDGPDEKGGDP